MAVWPSPAQLKAAISTSYKLPGSSLVRVRRCWLAGMPEMVQSSEEFVTCWKRWLVIGPASLAWSSRWAVVCKGSRPEPWRATGGGVGGEWAGWGMVLLRGADWSSGPGTVKSGSLTSHLMIPSKKTQWGRSKGLTGLAENFSKDLLCPSENLHIFFSLLYLNQAQFLQFTF